MNRKQFIRTTGLSIASFLLSDFLFSDVSKPRFIAMPDEVTAVVNDELVTLTPGGKNAWTHRDLSVGIRNTDGTIIVDIRAPRSSLSAVTLHWVRAEPSFPRIMNDHWERTYGDISWHAPAGSEILPWYFMECNGDDTNGFGVKTGAASFCSWRVDHNRLSLSMDTRSGGRGVRLGERTLRAAEIVTIRSRSGESPFETARRFTAMMCESARMPKKRVYGINDWYVTYGNNSEKIILDHTERMAPLADGLENRPFSVIDAGWYDGLLYAPNDYCWGDRMDQPNTKFGEMNGVAEKIKKIGMRPGIWTRPLCGSRNDSTSLMLPLIRGRKENRPVLDPTIPENSERIKNYFKLYADWGYEIVKFDFTTFDLLGKWGFEMIKDGAMTSPDWSMHDTSRTNAEIILALYKTIREGAGETYIIGCNTISHLSAGLFELNRIGDDTSGNAWERTRTMGVNTLAFRGVQHGTFYAADADCVGLTGKVAWEKNKQWMDLLARSGTPLFISAEAEATGSAQKAAIKESFRLASQTLPLGEPLDWMQHPFPKQWKLNGETAVFNWD